MSVDPVWAAWTDFPVSATPRPLVVVGGYVRVGPSGFVGGVAKSAFIRGAIEERVELPGGVAALLSPPSAAPPGDSGTRIAITAVSRTHAPFLTDRGLQMLPAYALAFDGANEPVLALDPALPVWWPKRPTAESTAGGSAMIDSDDRTVQVIAHGGVLTEFLGCRFIETDTAVLAEPLTRERDAGLRAVHAIGISKPVSGQLAKPLGDRVLIATNGLPIPVVPA